MLDLAKIIAILSGLREVGTAHKFDIMSGALPQSEEHHHPPVDAANVLLADLQAANIMRRIHRQSHG